MHGTVSIAYLGPEGTYTHQAAYDLFGSTANFIAKKSIADVFHSVSASLPFALIPQENTIFGPVIETYDLLRLPRAGDDIFVRGEITLRIQHCLLVRQGTAIQEVTEVLSHEQALGQCANFLKDHCPNAVLTRTNSTAAAARKLLDDPSIPRRAAICSKMCTTLYNGLEILYEGIQDQDDNYTRFFLLHPVLHDSLPVTLSGHPTVSRALLKIAVSPSSSPSCPLSASLSRMPISSLLRALTVEVVRIDRRPKPGQDLFVDVYFVEIQSTPDQGSTATLSSWAGTVEREVKSIIQVGGSGTTSILGIW